MKLKTVLLVDDDDAMRGRLEDILQEEGYRVLSASHGADALQLVRQNSPKVALLDVKPTAASGIQVLRELKQIAPDCVAVLMTAFADVDAAVTALREGAFHYLHQPVRPIELLNLLEGIFENIQIREEKRAAEKKLRQSEERFRTVFESAQDAIFLKEGGLQHYTLVNPAMEKMHGIAAPDFIGRTDRELFGAEVAVQTRSVEERVLRGEIVEQEEVRSRGGAQKIFHSIRIPMYGSGGAVCGLCGFTRDLTATRSLEAQLVQAQKMEAIGTLAGGISHDFNNLLQAIMGYTQILLIDKPEDHPDSGKLREIERASRRATALIKQLLAFGRKVEIDSRPVDINQVVRQVEELLKRTIPKMIQIELRLFKPLLTVFGDAGQLEQVLLNIGVNARDAMPEGGTLIIETGVVDPDEKFRTINLDGAKGPCILLSITDSGHGMGEEVLKRIFDPFFTTKKPGHGTGLGLAMAYGIIKNHHGHIACQSLPGRGTTFRIYLPAIDTMAEPQQKVQQIPMPKGRGQSILVIDDEPYLRTLLKDMLCGNGYQVLTAASGEEGLALYRQHASAVALVILDLIMPGMGGKQCLAEILNFNPQAKVLIASGYTMDDPDADEMLIRAKGFIPKPYHFHDMMQRMHELLGEGPEGEGASGGRTEG